MSRPTHAVPGGHAYLELQRRARADGLGTQELLIWYVHERFINRLSRSSHRDRLILKGGMLLVAFEARRATQDIDLLGRQIANDVSDSCAVGRCAGLAPRTAGGHTCVGVATARSCPRVSVPASVTRPVLAGRDSWSAQRRDESS